MSNEKKSSYHFVQIAEVVFAFFITASLYYSLEKVCTNNQYPILCLAKFFLCGFILIRFFFAPSSNIECILLFTRHHKLRQLSILLWDFPVLILHAGLYYGVCVTLWENKFWLDVLQESTPFFWLSLLLIVNLIWLITISWRLFRWQKKKKRIYRFYVWIINNLFFSILIVYLILSHFNYKYTLLLLSGYANCIIDIILTAPDYLEQRDRNKPVIKIKNFSLWPNVL